MTRGFPGPRGAVVLALLAFGILAGCASRRPVSAFVYDQDNRPIAGALVYVEAWKHPGTYDFCFGVTGEDGKMPASGSAAPTLLWKGSARLAYAAFAPGKDPLGIVDYRHGVEPDNMHIQLTDSTGKGPSIRKLGFPFPDNPELHARAAAPEAAPLREAFWNHIYRRHLDSSGALPEGNAEYEAMNRLMKPTD